MDERTVSLHGEAAGKGEHVLLGHAERDELFGMPVPEAIDFAGGGEVRRNAQHFGSCRGEGLEGLGVGRLTISTMLRSLPSR